MPKVSEEHLTARREQILDGARRAFAKHGYAGATVARLEEETGLSRGAIFNYFPDKWSLFIALAGADQHMLIDTFAADGIDGLLRRIAEENPDWLAVYFELAMKVRTDPERMQEFLERAPEGEQRRAADTVERLQAVGAMRDDVSADTLGTFINALANGLALAVSLGATIDVAEFLRLVHEGVASRSQ